MEGTVEDRLVQAVNEAKGRYYRLVLLVGQPRSGKTTALRAVADDLEQAPVNMNLVLTEQLLDLTKRQRALRVKRILLAELDKTQGEQILLDNIEVLFDTELAQDPLRLLQGLSRNRTITSTWPGTFDGTYLTYAQPGHPEWRRYSKPEASIVSIEQSPPPAATAHHASPNTGAQERR